VSTYSPLLPDGSNTLLAPYSSASSIRKPHANEYHSPPPMATNHKTLISFDIDRAISNGTLDESVMRRPRDAYEARRHSKTLSPAPNC